MEITAQFKVHSRTETESTEKEYVLVPIRVPDEVEVLEAITDEEFDRLSDEVEGFRFGRASLLRVDSGISTTATMGVVVRTTEDMSPGERLTLTLAYAPVTADR